MRLHKDFLADSTDRNLLVESIDVCEKMFEALIDEKANLTKHQRYSLHNRLQWNFGDWQVQLTALFPGF